jgi:hypothetical protein
VARLGQTLRTEKIPPTDRCPSVGRRATIPIAATGQSKKKEEEEEEEEEEEDEIDA